MSSNLELKKNADELRKNKQFKDASNIYSKLWCSDDGKSDIWVGWGYAFCLRHLQEYDNALQICREVYKLKPDFRYNNDVYAWCIYYKEISNNDVSDESTFLKAAEAILKLSKQAKYSPYEVTVFKVLDFYNNKPIFPAGEILKWTARLDPLILDDTTFVGKTKDGKKKELASRKEKYYMLRTKALFENKNFTECINLSEFALSNFKKFHYDNDIWFKRHIANSNFMMGKLDIAVNQLKEILQKKKEWFIQKEIADVYFKKRDYKNSLKYAVASAINFGKIDNKVHLFELLYEILIALKNPVLAKKHIEMVCLIRKNNKWNFSDDFSKLLDKLKIDIEILPQFNTLKSELKSNWKQLKYSDKKINSGIIKTILPHGKAGFVISETNESYYFSVSNINFHPKQLSEGLKVSFYIEDSFDKKKQQNSKIAVNINLIGGKQNG